MTETSHDQQSKLATQNLLATSCKKASGPFSKGHGLVYDFPHALGMKYIFKFVLDNFQKLSFYHLKV